MASRKTTPFAVFDIDGTLIRWQMLHAMIDELGRASHLAQEDYESVLQMRMNWKQRKAEEGFREYERQLVAVIEKSITEITLAAFTEAAESVYEQYKDQVYRYSRQLIAKLKAEGYLLLAVSGSPQEAIAPLCRYYGFDDYIGSDYVKRDGKFTGKIFVAAHNKPQLLRYLVAKHQLRYEDSVGMGDSEGDIDMLDMVEHPIAFNPSKKLFLHASQKGWKIVVERKNMVYELESQSGEHYKLARTNAEG
jgi:HAD superfamily hydrolase (TIGR01490 family)